MNDEKTKDASIASLLNAGLGSTLGYSGVPESIPEDREHSFPCDCGGNITANFTGDWRCDSCEIIP